MPLFGSSKPTGKEVRGFGRGKTASAKAAEQYAKKKRDQAATRASQKARREADRRAGRQK
jgi:hypothetical protein